MIPLRISQYGPFSTRDKTIDRYRASLIVTLFLAPALMGTFLGCRSHGTQATATQPLAGQVSVIQIQPEPLTTVVPVTGALISLAAVDVKAEVAGRVIRFDKMEGDAVRAGQTVVWLDRERADLTMRQAET